MSGVTRHPRLPQQRAPRCPRCGVATGCTGHRWTDALPVLIALAAIVGILFYALVMR